MKRIVSLICCVTISASAFAQSNNNTGKSTTNPTTTIPAPIQAASQQAIMDRLVELAEKNPAARIAKFEHEKTVAELNKAGASWLNYIIVSANLNEITLHTYSSADVQKNNIYYPLWNVGLIVPLGSFWEKADNIKVARRNVDIAVAQQENVTLTLKAMVLSKYHDYLMKKELLTNQNEITEDDLAAMNAAEQKFSSGAIKYDEYSAATKSYNDQLVKKVTLETDMAKAKLELEAIIGMRLEDIFIQGK